MTKFTVRLRIEADIDVTVDAVGPKEAENFAKHRLANAFPINTDDVSLSDLADIGNLRVWAERLRDAEIIEVEELNGAASPSAG